MPRGSLGKARFFRSRGIVSAICSKCPCDKLTCKDEFVPEGCGHSAPVDKRAEFTHATVPGHGNHRWRILFYRPEKPKLIYFSCNFWSVEIKRYL